MHFVFRKPNYCKHFQSKIILHNQSKEKAKTEKQILEYPIDQNQCVDIVHIVTICDYCS